MFRTARRPVSTLALLLFLAPSITGCKTTQQIPFSNNAVRLDRISGVTTRSGREIRFRLPGASIVNDTMYAVGQPGRGEPADRQHRTVVESEDFSGTHGWHDNERVRRRRCHLGHSFVWTELPSVRGSFVLRAGKRDLPCGFDAAHSCRHGWPQHRDAVLLADLREHVEGWELTWRRRSRQFDEQAAECARGRDNEEPSALRS